MKMTYYQVFRKAANGGVTDIFRVGHVSKRQLRDLMFAFIAGLHAAGMEG